MEELVLPQGLSSQSNAERKVFACSYESKKPSIKSRIILDWHLFSFLLEGEKVVSYASGTKGIDNTSFFFLPYGNCLMSEKLAQEGQYKSVLLFVSKAVFKDFFNSYPASKNSNEKSYHQLEVEPRSIKKDDYIDNFISSLQIALSNQNLNTDHVLRLKFEELMMYLLQQDESLLPYFKSLCEEWDEDALIRKIVNIHMNTGVTVEELAFLCNMSISTFKRKFTKIFNDAPKQWFFKSRMQKATELLKQQGLKASEIYEDLGYENLSSFVQAFKKVYGVTPKQYQLSE
ncbi:AraC family transcriptional regulator [Chryseobacterium sp.]|uniref:helix-turn-helix domain-containing protein n=1 Tax=Chryseobacterium sp. TaxID=1871047 RepID=UPI00289ACF99|nr:AraC family transcriptional regulator [Chryseobacterium sp.]